MEAQQLSKGRKITAWVLVSLITALLLFSGFGKIMASGNPDAEMYKNFARWGLDGKLTLIAIGEIISAVLFLIPRTSSLGVLLLSAHFGGAIATHMEHGESYLVPAVILLVIWIANYVRNPEMLASFTKK